MSESEEKARVELAACYRIFAQLGWTQLIYNHITLRLPGPEKHFLINPFGLHYSEVCASNLVKIDLDIQRKCTRDSLQFAPAFGGGRDVFDALTRMLDRVDTSYKN